MTVTNVLATLVALALATACLGPPEPGASAARPAQAPGAATPQEIPMPTATPGLAAPVVPFIPILPLPATTPALAPATPTPLPPTATPLPAPLAARARIPPPEPRPGAPV